MFLVRVVTLIVTSSPSRGGVAELGHSALRALVVLPAWPDGRWLGRSELGVTGGIGMIVLALITALWFYARNSNATHMHSSSSFDKVRHPRTR
jgi:hypothetical protein